LGYVQFNSGTYPTRHRFNSESGGMYPHTPTYRRAMAFLTDARVRAARPQEKAYKLFDSLGLYLKVEPRAAVCGASSTTTRVSRSC
jgi:hypothetical protein